jgi:ATP-binding cassette, subfamily B, bacterial HlyB/CyaB
VELFTVFHRTRIPGYLSAFAGPVEPFIFQVIIDRILPFQREASLVVVVAVFAAATLFQVGFEILSAMLSIITANRVTRDLGSRIFDHLLKLPYRYFRRWSVGETITRISKTDRIRSFLIGTSTARSWISCSSLSMSPFCSLSPPH